MNKTRMIYFEKDDVLHLAISDEPEKGSAGDPVKSKVLRTVL